MKIRQMFLTALIVAGFLSACQADSFAEHKYGRFDKHEDETMEDKLFKKVKYLLYNADDVQLTKDQHQKLVVLKNTVKKDLIMKDAQIDVIKVDVKALLWGDPVDLGAMNKLIDQKYDVKKEKARVLAKAFADLKKILTPDQKEMLKAHYMEKYKGSMKGSGYHK